MSDPIPVDQALAIVLSAAPALPAEEVSLEDAAGRILRDEVRADHDFPPFDKSLMDGYAVIASDLAAVPRSLRIVEEIPAGSDPMRLQRLEPGTASRVMTGAPLPPGADAVLVVEETEAVPGDPAAVRARSDVRPGDNLARRGTDVRRGDVLLAPGRFIGAAEIGVLAACGRTRVAVSRRPRVAILATGDELVEPGEAPGPGRIRNSNAPMLVALARRAGAEPLYLGIARDDEAALRQAVGRGLESDALVLSGGVSMGLYDLVGKTLRSLGVAIRFERVAIKPGKPFTFGARGETPVFGCPGNPVSAYVIFQVFVRPALRRMTGFPNPAPAVLRGTLAGPVRQRPGRAGYHQALARWDGAGLLVEVLPTTGSADFLSCARGNALAVVPAEVASMAAGDPVDVILLDDHADR
jgi:molybdopterin molybdotransferase